jgi:hypothetical protein
MSSAYSKETSCAIKTFIQSLSSVWSLPGKLEGSESHNSAKTRQKPKISPKFMSEQPQPLRAYYFEKLVLRTIKNTLKK